MTARTTRLHATWARVWPQNDFNRISAGFATAAVLWGLTLLAPGDSFSRAPAWAFFAGLCGNDAVWGAVALGLGLLQHAGRITHQRPLRLVAAIAGTGFWLFVSLAFVIPVGQGGPWGPANAIYPLMFGGYAWIWREVRVRDA